MPTIYDVAQEANVSISTVSHVLNNTRFVSEETKARVLEAVDKLGYRPSSLARAMVRQETRTIALIVPDNVNPFFAELARGIEDYGFGRGYNVFLCNSDRRIEKELAYLGMLISKRIDGLIYMTVGISIDQIKPLIDHNIPIVVLDFEYEGIDSILLGNFQGGYDATRYLIDLGHRSIACISGPDVTLSYERVRGYERALQEAGLLADKALILCGNWTYQSGMDAAAHLLESGAPPTAIFACNDMMGIGVLSFLHKQGVKVPEDISVVGFDNIGLSGFVYPPLTTLATPIPEIGQRLCQLLLDRINGQLPAEPQHITMCGQLLVRSSAGEPKKTDHKEAF